MVVMDWIARIPDELVKAFVLIAFIAFFVATGWISLIVMKLLAARERVQLAACARRYGDYMACLRMHIAAEPLLPAPPGRMSGRESRYLLHELTEWMARIRGEEFERLQELCRRLGFVGQQLRRLKHPLPGRRLEAAYRLGLMRAPEAFPHLADALADAGRDPQAFMLARAAIRCAARPEEVEQVALQLARHYGDAARLTADMIREAATDPAEVTRRLLNSGHPALERAALIGLPTAVDPQVGASLDPFMETGDKEMRLEAVRAFLQTVPQLPREQVEALLQDPDWEIRAEAIRGLGHLGEPSAAVLIAAAGEDDSHNRVREESARSLAKLLEDGVQAIGGEENEEELRHNHLLHTYRKYREGRSRARVG